MSPKQPSPTRLERTFQRFTLGQRWEHTVLVLSLTVLLLTGLPQKYRNNSWSQLLLSSPERVAVVQQIHHIAALVLTAEVLYHLGRAIYLISRRRLPGDMLPNMQDLRDAWQMIRYLLFLTRDKPRFGKYNFEQKFTYWFLFFGIGIMTLSGFVLWFPEAITRLLPGGIIPAAFLAHSNEAVVAAVFVIIWHFYHVHFERLNLSIFSGRLSESEMQTYHTAEYERITRAANDKSTNKSQSPTRSGGSPS